MLKTSIDSMKFAKGIKNLKSAQSELEKARAAQYIIELSNKHGGLFAKIVQLLGTSSNQIEELKQWQKSFDSGLKAKDIESIVSNEFNCNWSEIFLKIHDECFCASIGQVNKANLLNGTLVALKVQYPMIEKSIRDQLKFLKVAPMVQNFGPMKKWSINVDSYYSMVSDTLTKELDYKREVENQIAYAKSVSKLSFVKVAKVYTEFVSKKCYVQEFIEADQIDAVLNSWSHNEKLELSKKLLKTFLFTVFEGGVIHEDSNHYNYLFLKDPEVKVCVLDFGQCIYVDQKFSLALLKLFDMAINETADDPFGYLVDLGFDSNKLKHIHPSLSIIMKILLDPFISNYNYDLKTWNYKEKIDKVLGDMKWWFRSSGGVRFFEVMKSFVGIKNIIERLEVKFNWQQVYFEILNQVSQEWKSYETLNTPNEQYTFDAVAKKLKVRVIESGIEKVNASFPINVLVDIEEFIAEDVLNQLEKDGVEPKELVRKKVSEGVQPGDVFYLVDDKKEYRVWLE